MGKLQTISSSNLLVSNTGEEYVDGLYIRRKTLRNNKYWYFKDNVPGIVDFFIYYNTSVARWDLANVFTSIYRSDTDAANPWETTWTVWGEINVSETSLSNNKISIKKQNLTNLLPYALDNFKNLYIFKGGGANTIGTVFNKDDFIKDDAASAADQLRIFNPDLTTGATYYVRSSNNTWARSAFGAPDATNVVIAENSPIQILTNSDPSLNLPKSINNGAIVQRYYNGKISLFFDTLPLNTQSIKLNLSYTIGGCGNDFVLMQNSFWSQNGCDFYVRWDNKDGTLPYKWRFFYSSDGRTDYASHPTAGPDSLPKKGWSNGMTISENQLITFGQSLVVNNLPFDADANCNFSIFNRTWIYLGAPSFRYRPIDNLSYHIITPLTPDGYGGNGSYQIRSSDEVYFTNGYSNSDKFPANNWQLAPYIINNCSQITTTPIFSLL